MAANEVCGALLLLLLIAMSSAAWNPGDQVQSLELDGLDGPVQLDLAPGSRTLPLVIMALNSEDAFSRYMWSNSSSLEDFRAKAPTHTSFLFLSYSENAEAEVSALRDRLFLDKTSSRSLQDRTYFGREPVSKLQSWLPGVLSEWTSPRKVAVATSLGGWTLTTERLDSAYGWLPWPDESAEPHPLAYMKSPCSSAPFLQGHWALVIFEGLQSKEDCSYADVILRVQEAGGLGVVFASAPDEDVEVINCQDSRECSLALTIPAIMIPLKLAQKIKAVLDSGEAVSLSCRSEEAPGFFAAVDSPGQLAEVGWAKFPSLMTLVWAAQWLEYQQELYANLSKPALVLPVFQDEVMQGTHGISANITLPPLTRLREEYDTLELDMSLSCPGRRDEDCPIWDHVVRLFVCCEDSCEPCSVTPWLSITGTSRGASPSEGNVNSPESCGRELGRWITPFRRRIGRWLTDITTLMPLLSSSQCQFTMQTVPWAMPWKPSLNLRFRQERLSKASQETPQEAEHFPATLIPILGGGTFDSGYNEGRKAIRFQTPKGLVKAKIVSVITGHGYDDHACAEFCPTSHHFHVNGHDHLVNYSEAGTEWGCADKVREGVEPNEHGTWQYGRNGWCDGQEVRPWEDDISMHLFEPGGANNRVEYVGLYLGKDPHPSQSPGYILMQANVALYGHDSIKLDDH